MAIVLGLRFLCEMAALAGVAYWGQQAADGVAGIGLAAIAVAVVAVVWGLFLAPRRRLEVGLPARVDRAGGLGRCGLSAVVGGPAHAGRGAVRRRRRDGRDQRTRRRYNSTRVSTMPGPSSWTATP